MGVKLKFATLLRRCHTSLNFLGKANCKAMKEMNQKLTTRQCEEVQIKVPWGYIAGKWWGTKSVRPIVGIHGWQDNAGTFDTLAPLLPDHVGFLAVDLPGHGLSSRLPNGLDYSHMSYIYVLRLLMKENNWDKLSIIGHSLSSSVGFVFSALFPNKIDMMIGFDMLKPLVRPPSDLANLLGKNMEAFIIANERNMENLEPPSYSYDECLEKFYLGLHESVNRDKCFYILDRNIEKSKNYPNKFYFNRDNRLKHGFGMYSQELCVELAKKITSTPYMFINAKGSPYFEDEKNVFQVLEIMKKTNPNFEYYEIDGSHHLHLNEPENIADLINKLINKIHSPHVTSA